MKFLSWTNKTQKVVLTDVKPICQIVPDTI